MPGSIGNALESNDKGVAAIIDLFLACERDGRGRPDAHRLVEDEEVGCARALHLLRQVCSFTTCFT